MLTKDEIAQLLSYAECHAVALKSGVNGNGGNSGEAFKVNFEGKTYKIRRCKDAAKACKMTDWLNYLTQHPCTRKHINPLIGQQGNTLIFEWLPGQEVHPSFERDIVMCAFGKTVGEIHQCPIPPWENVPTTETLLSQFNESLSLINNDLVDQGIKPQHLRKSLEQNIPSQIISKVIYSNGLSCSNIMDTGDPNNPKMIVIDHEKWSVRLPLGGLLRQSYRWGIEDPSLNFRALKKFWDGYRKTGIPADKLAMQSKFTDVFFRVTRAARNRRMGRTVFHFSKEAIMLKIAADSQSTPFLATIIPELTPSNRLF